MATDGPLTEADAAGAPGARYTAAPAGRARPSLSHEDDGITTGPEPDVLPEGDVPARFSPAPGAGAGALTDAGGAASDGTLRQARTAEGR